MSEWSIEHAWKSDRFTRSDAHQIPPTHVRSISSRYNDVPRDVPISDDVQRGGRGVCDTVLTQNPVTFSERTSSCVTVRTAMRCQRLVYRKVVALSTLSWGATPAPADVCGLRR